MATIQGDKLDNQLIGTDDDDVLYGKIGNDTLYGNAGNDILRGGIDIDRLEGGLGNDRYFVDNYKYSAFKDKIIELANGGTDTVFAGVDWVLSAYLENLVLIGDAWYGTGNHLANKIIGNQYDNVLDGGKGLDTLIGKQGNDHYSVTRGDKVVEKAGGGLDTVAASISWVLGENVENLSLSGTQHVNGTGNDLNNQMYGNDANNILNGKSGADTFYAGGGDDVIKLDKFDGFYASALAKDNIYGGWGQDTLKLTGANSIIDAQRDVIYGVETIDLTGSGANRLQNVLSNAVMRLSDTDLLTVHGDSDDVVSLNNNSGVWSYNGIVNGMKVYTAGVVELRIDQQVQVIEDVVVPEYKIFDAASAQGVSDFFDAGAQKVIIDFANKYRLTDVEKIDLTGFGLEDTLIIMQSGGAVDNAQAYYGSKRSQYIVETSYTLSYSNSISDRVSWQIGASKALLLSKDMHYTGNNHGTNSSTSSYSYPVSTLGSIQIVGLPKGLADTQFVFV